MDFADIVKAVRKQLGLSQQSLADALNMSFSTINRWENGHVVPSKLAQKTFINYCEDNFIDVSKLQKTDNE